MAEIFMTAEGKKQLEERLKDLKVNGRAEMAEKIRVAREFGDLSENAEYDIAKEEQAKMEAEIIEIEAKLRNVQIIDEKVKGDKADVGSKIEIKDVKTGAVYSYTIVGTHESNPMEGRISNESPIGKAVLGKRKGAEVVVKAPMGDAVYKIVDIK
ncbi:transcription elongation factor GreA [Pumilibacter muris]|jgi:transcription elongation factor GreA|uniref:transcription elongation factor GreA n=1 Tax=Pumilibacter muris TaxID=2941510 RepID=UPI00203DFF21|nr:transcription elongation factor GreA [Pumilibacter muris]